MPEDDTRHEIAALDAEAEGLRDAAERCRKTISLAWLAAVAGPLLIAAGWWRGDPMLLVLGIAAALGGFVLAGATRTTRAELLCRIAELDQRRGSLIDAIDWSAGSGRIVGSG